MKLALIALLSLAVASCIDGDPYVNASPQTELAVKAAQFTADASAGKPVPAMSAKEYADMAKLFPALAQGPIAQGTICEPRSCCSDDGKCACCCSQDRGCVCTCM